MVKLNHGHTIRDLRQEVRARQPPEVSSNNKLPEVRDRQPPEVSSNNKPPEVRARQPPELSPKINL